MIRTLLRVEERDIMTKGRDAAFIEVLTQWEILPWIKYLRKYGKIVNVEHYSENSTYANTYRLTWELPEEREVWFHLNYSQEQEKIKRLT